MFPRKFFRRSDSSWQEMEIPPMQQRRHQCGVVAVERQHVFKNTVNGTSRCVHGAQSAFAETRWQLHVGWSPKVRSQQEVSRDLKKKLPGAL